MSMIPRSTNSRVLYHEEDDSYRHRTLQIPHLVRLEPLRRPRRRIDRESLRYNPLAPLPRRAPVARTSHRPSLPLWFLALLVIVPTVLIVLFLLHTAR